MLTLHTLRIHEIDEALNIGLPEDEELETITGCFFNPAGRLIDQDEVFDYANVTLRAEQVENTRIQKAQVTVDRNTVDPVEKASPRGEDNQE